MVDLNTSSTPPNGERSKIKNFMGRTPGIGALKSKFLTVLGNSNELLNGISNKLTLSLSSSDSEYCLNEDEELPKFDETIDYTKIDFESRRVKARRAHEELISGCYRHPNLAPRLRLQSSSDTKMARKRSSSSSTSSASSSDASLQTNAATRSQVSSTTRSNSIESRHSGGYGRPGRAIAGARRSELDIKRDLLKVNEILKPGMSTPQIDVQPPSDREIGGGSQQFDADRSPNIEISTMAATTSGNSMRLPTTCSRASNSSTLTSLYDEHELQLSTSLESTDWINFIRSESQNSVPSWASSISLDCRANEEPVKEFMKRFTDILCTNAPAISLELKSEFGAMARLEIGRQLFTRFMLEQKTKSKRLDELTFHSLLQYFVIVLFECSEYEDYGPAAVIMNLCFHFYHEIEVPGCDPYRQYLFTFMRTQPIWRMLRFWNAAFFSAVQNERDHRLALRHKRAEKSQKKKDDRDVASIRLHATDAMPAEQKPAAPIRQASSSSSSHHSNAHVGSKRGSANADIDKEQQSLIKLQENIVFQQLGAFTCNMHALGVPLDLCLEFFKKQSNSLSLTKDKTKLIKDNILRMYHETDLWGAKER